MAKRKLTVPLMERADAGNHDLNGICVSGRSLELLMEIKGLLDVFAPSGDDYRHSLWIEVPRGKPSDWCSFNHAKDWAEEEVYTRADYLKEWKSNYPMESQWYHIALALYEAGAPLLLHDAQKILDILEAKDYVKLTPHTFHDYLNHHEEGSVFSLPYECYLGDGDEITREQYDEIVSLAQWSPVTQLKLDDPVPLEDSVYDPIRDEVSEAMTVCAILARLYKKYGIGVGISNYDDHQHIYLYGWKKGDEKIQIKDKEFMSANEAMLTVLRMFAEDLKENG